MTFIPQLGYYLMRPGKPLPPVEYRRTHGMTGLYYKLGHYAREHRKEVFVGCSRFFFSLAAPWSGTPPTAERTSSRRTYSTFRTLMCSSRTRAAISDNKIAATRSRASGARGSCRLRPSESRFRRQTSLEILKSITSFVGGSGHAFLVLCRIRISAKQLRPTHIPEIYNRTTCRLGGQLRTALTRFSARCLPRRASVTD